MACSLPCQIDLSIYLCSPQITNQRGVISAYLAERICRGLETKTDCPSIRVCSLGCGDGQLDMDTIVKVLTKHPEVTVDFLAVDINKSSCEKALELFAAVTREYGKRFNFNVVCCDILEIPVQEHRSFDVVTVVHTLYFVPSLENVLKKCYELKKSDGGGFTQVNVRNMGWVHKTVSVSKHYSSWVYP